IHGLASAGLALLDADAHQLDRAVQLARKAVEQMPESADGYIALGNALSESGKREEALNAIDQALELEPHNRRGLLLKASIAVRGASGPKQLELASAAVNRAE